MHKASLLYSLSLCGDQSVFVHHIIGLTQETFGMQIARLSFSDRQQEKQFQNNIGQKRIEGKNPP